MSDSDDNELDVPILEAPLLAESPTSGMGTLFGEESLAMNAAKLAFSEALLSLLTKNISFHDFVREVLLATVRTVKCEAGSIFELDQKSGSLFFRAVSGQASDSVTRFTIPVGQGIVGHVAESRQPMVVDDVSGNRQHIRAISAAIGYEARNIVAVPILIRGRLYGVIELLNRIGEHHFTATDVELLQYIADYAAKGLEVRLMLAWAMKNQARKEAA